MKQVDDEVELTLVSEDGFFTILIVGIEPLIALFLAPILMYVYWDNLMSFTFIAKEWLGILWIGLYFIFGIMIIVHIKNYLNRKLKSTINTDGIDGESWKRIVDLKINHNGKIAQIDFRDTWGGGRSYVVEMDNQQFEKVNNIKDQFFDPTNKVIKIYLPGEKRDV